MPIVTLSKYFTHIGLTRQSYEPRLDYLRYPKSRVFRRQPVEPRVGEDLGQVTGAHV